MRRTIPHRELRNQSSQILRDVEAGESIEITNYGKVVAVISPVQDAPKPPLPVTPSNPQASFESLTPVKAAISSSEILDELRGER